MKLTKQLLLATALFSMYACNNETSSGDDLYVDEAACVANAEWFNLVDGSRKTPAPNEGPTSVFADNVTVTNCDFHRWSWQKFLWLTNDVGGQPLFMDKLMQVSSHGQKLDQNKGIILVDVAQASGTADTLRTPDYASGTPPTTTVYYSIWMDDLSYGTMVKYGPIAKDDPGAVKDITFPVGALELKTAWMDVVGLADTSSYFIADGEINGIKARVALLAMHVVGVVENHPEFVWATFEHEGLVPSYDWDAATPTSDAPVTSTTEYPFFNKEATATVTNITSRDGPRTDVFSVYKYGAPVEKIDPNNEQVYMETSQKEPENFDHITNINQSVKTQLSGIWNNYFYNGSIWINTEGYETTADQANLLDSLSSDLSNSDTNDLTRGSVAAYNITMETYVQVGFGGQQIYETTVNDLANCFSCHNTNYKDNNSPLNISHIFTGYVGNLDGMSKEQIKQDHVDEILRQHLMRKAKLTK